MPPVVVLETPEGALLADGYHRVAAAQRAGSDRVLATVLFTDIVASTEKAAELGDAAWKGVLASHDERAKTEIAKLRGSYVSSTGDGLFGHVGRRWIGSLGRFAKLLVSSPFVKQLPGLRGAKDPGDRLLVLKELIEARRITPVIDRTYPLSDVPAAIRCLEEGHAQGKAVICVGG